MSNSSRDLVIAQIEHRESDPLPYTLDFEGDVTEWTTAESRFRNPALQSLPAMALLLLDDGAPARAVELYPLAWRYPYVANSRWFEDVAGREISAAAEALPPEVVAAAQERGRARDLWATVEELLDELKEGGDQGRTG